MSIHKNLYVLKRDFVKTMATSSTDRVEDRKKELYQELVSDVNNEFKSTGDKLLQDYGHSTVTRKTIETFNGTINEEVKKKLENVKDPDPKKVKKQYSSLSKFILKEAKKVDEIIKRLGAILRMTPVGDIGVLGNVEASLKKGQTLVDKYGEMIDTFDEKHLQTGFGAKIKKKLCCFK